LDQQASCNEPCHWLDPKEVLRNELFSGAIWLQSLVHGSICFFFSRAPWPALIDKPTFRRVGLADLRFRTTMVDDLVITIAGLLVSIFHPKSSLIYDIR
jgi:hypothetical protein